MESRNRMGGQQRFPFFLFPLHFDHTHYPYFFSFVLGERRIVKMRRSSFFFRSDFCQREIPSQNPTDIRKKMPSLVYINARGRNICFTKRKKHAVFLSDTSPLFTFTQRRGQRSFCRPTAQGRRLFSKPTERFKKTVRHLQTTRKCTNSQPEISPSKGLKLLDKATSTMMQPTQKRAIQRLQVA